VDFILNNIWLVAIALISGGMLLWPLLSQSAGGPSLSTLQATQLINQKDALVLDLRSTDEYARGHILHARSVPAAQLGGRMSELEKFKNRPLILSCQNGTTSGATLGALKKAGFGEVYVLAGGVSAWQQAGLPVTK
jgi:rhodanese-related sulfurtransferase